MSRYADPVAQAEFKKTFSRKVLAAVPPGIPLESIDVWFQDEMRIGQRGTQTGCGPAGEVPHGSCASKQSESAYVFGAVCAPHDAAVGLVMPHSNQAQHGAYASVPANWLSARPRSDPCFEVHGQVPLQP